MSSTTMHTNPHIPIINSMDLVNREIVSYEIDILGDTDIHTLSFNANDYGRGSWAGSLRYNNGTWYLSTFSDTTGRTYVSSTPDIEKDSWKTVSFEPCYHGNTPFF